MLQCVRMAATYLMMQLVNKSCLPKVVRASFIHFIMGGRHACVYQYVLTCTIVPTENSWNCIDQHFIIIVTQLYRI